MAGESREFGVLLASFFSTRDPGDKSSPIPKYGVKPVVVRCRCAGGVLQLAVCDDSVDEWRYYVSGDFVGFTLGAGHEFMACWDTGDSWEELQHADERPLHKVPFQAVGPALGCTWSKVQD